MSTSKNKLSERLRNIEQSQRQLHDALLFVMNTIKIKVVMKSGIAGPTGQPLPGVEYEGSLLDAYKEALARANAAANSTPAPLVTEN